jgi:hypothetical protein
MTNTQQDETTPDQLLESFRGSNLKTIIVFTLIVHAVVLLGSSVPYLWKTVAGGDSSKLGEKERMEIAEREAASSLREIASKHGVKPEELSSRFAGAVPATAKVDTKETAAPAPEAEIPAADEAPKSAIEKELNTKEAGPALPAIEDEKEDLFK